MPDETTAPASSKKKNESLYEYSGVGQAKDKPQAVDVVVSARGHGTVADLDISFQAPLGDRGQTYLCAEKVPNPGRYYDGYRARGGQVKVNLNGTVKVPRKADGVLEDVPAYDVYVMVPEGELVKVIKKSKKKGEGATPSGTTVVPPTPPTPPAADAKVLRPGQRR